MVLDAVAHDRLGVCPARAPHVDVADRHGLDHGSKPVHTVKETGGGGAPTPVSDALFRDVKEAPHGLESLLRHAG